MAFTRADYELFATALNEAEVSRDARIEVALSLANYLTVRESRFDPVRFLQQVDPDVTEEEIADYSHALFLRSQTGVGATRNRLHHSA